MKARTHFFSFAAHGKLKIHSNRLLTSDEEGMPVRQRGQPRGCGGARRPVVDELLTDPRKKALLLQKLGIGDEENGVNTPSVITPRKIDSRTSPLVGSQ